MRIAHLTGMLVVAYATLGLAACGPAEQALLDPDDLSHLDKFVAFYPREVGLLTDPALDRRLAAMMGEPELAAMQQSWQTEGPIVREQDVISASGCMDNDCAAVGYILYVDLANDNINVYAFIDGEMMSYDETGPIELPPGLAAEFEVEKQNRLNLPAAPDEEP